MSSSPSVWFWFWRSRSLGFVDLGRAGHGQLLKLILVRCEGPQSSYLMHLGVAAFKAHAGFWGVGQDLKSQALKCSVVWFCPGGYFVGVVLVRVGFFCLMGFESLTHGFIACGCKYQSTWVSFSPTLPQSLLTALCWGKHLYLYQGICGNIWKFAGFEF